MKKLLWSACFIPSIAFAAPVKIPTLALCAQANGTLVVRQKCPKFETKVALSSLQIKGEPDPAGTFDVNRCIKREQSSRGSDTVTTTVACLVNEFVVSSGCYASDGPGATFGSRLLAGENSTVGADVYGLVKCGGYDPSASGQPFTVTAQALCCVP